MTAALTHSSYVETFQFSAGQRTVRVSMICFFKLFIIGQIKMDGWIDVVLISGGRLFHVNGPATEKLRGPKPAVLVRGTTRSP